MISDPRLTGTVRIHERVGLRSRLLRVFLWRLTAPGCSRIWNHSSSDSLQSLHVQHDPVGESREDCVPSEAFHSTRVALAMGTELWTRASGMPRDEGKPPSPHFNNHGAGFMPDPRWQVLAFLPNLSLHPEGAFASTCVSVRLKMRVSLH